MTAAVEIPEWAVTTVLALAGVGAVLGGLIKLLPQVRELWVRFNKMLGRAEEAVDAKLALEESLRHMRRVRAIELVLQHWVKRKGAQRALLLTANNGGEAWSGKGPLFVSNPAQVVGPANPNTIDLWQGWKADGWYCKFLGNLLEVFRTKRGYPLLCPEVEDPDDENQVHGVLRDQYADQGTCASLVLPFAWKHGSVLWYVSLNFGRVRRKQVGGQEQVTEITPQERRDFEQAMLEIYNNPARCRALTLELEHAFNSVR